MATETKDKAPHTGPDGPGPAHPPQGKQGKFATWVHGHKPLLIGLIILVLALLYFISSRSSGGTSDTTSAATDPNTGALDNPGYGGYGDVVSGSPAETTGSAATDAALQGLSSQQQADEGQMASDEAQQAADEATEAGDAGALLGKINKQKAKTKALRQEVKGLGHVLHQIQKGHAKPHPKLGGKVTQGPVKTVNHRGAPSRPQPKAHLQAKAPKKAGHR